MKTCAISRLPEGVRNELISRAALAGLSGYRQLARWLAAQGFSISISSLHRSLSRFANELALVQRAQFLQAAQRSRLRFDVALLTVVLSDLAKARARRTRRNGARERA